MQIEIDTLKYVKLLMGKGVETKEAEAVIETLADIELRNLYNKQEIDTMMSEAVKDVFRECDQRRQDFNERMKMLERKNREELQRANERAAADSARMEKLAAADSARMEKRAAADLAETKERTAADLAETKERAAADLLETRKSRRWQTGIIVSTIVMAWTSLAGLIHYIH